MHSPATHQAAHPAAMCCVCSYPSQTQASPPILQAPRARPRRTPPVAPRGCAQGLYIQPMHESHAYVFSGTLVLARWHTLMPAFAACSCPPEATCSPSSPPCPFCHVLCFAMCCADPTQRSFARAAPPAASRCRVWYSPRPPVRFRASASRVRTENHGAPHAVVRRSPA